VLAVTLIVAIAVAIGVAPHYVGTVKLPEPDSTALFSMEDSLQAALWNAAVVITLVIAYTYIALAVAGRGRLLELVMATVWFLGAMAAVWFYAILYYYAGLLHPAAALAAIFAAPVAAVPVALTVLRSGDSPLFGVMGALLGAMVAQLFPRTTVLAMLAALAAYDLVSAKWGPMNKLIERAVECRCPCGVAGRGAQTPLPGLLVKLGERAVGVGDFVAYGMAATFIAVGATKLGVVASLAMLAAALVAIYIGLRATLKWAEAEGAAPALPVPLAMLAPLLFAAWMA